MKTLIRHTISNAAFAILANKLEVSKTEPYVFYLKGKKHKTALTQLGRWARKYTAELTVLGTEPDRLKLEITDPVAVEIEHFHKN